MKERYSQDMDDYNDSSNDREQNIYRTWVESKRAKQIQKPQDIEDIYSSNTDEYND